MHLSTHLLSGWLTAHAFPGHDRRIRCLATIAALAPDLDGVPILWDFIHDALWPGAIELYWYTKLHHVVGHSLVIAPIVAAILTFFTPGGALRRGGAFALYLACFCLHIGLDLIGTVIRIELFWPISDAPFMGPTWFRWEIENWRNYATFYAMAGVATTIFLGWARSPLELVSGRIDRYLHTVVTGLVPGRRCESAGCERRGFYRCDGCEARMCGEHGELAGLGGSCGGCVRAREAEGAAG